MHAFFFSSLSTDTDGRVGGSEDARNENEEGERARQRLSQARQNAVVVTRYADESRVFFVANENAHISCVLRIFSPRVISNRQ